MTNPNIKKYGTGKNRISNANSRCLRLLDPLGIFALGTQCHLGCKIIDSIADYILSKHDDEYVHVSSLKIELLC